MTHLNADGKFQSDKYPSCPPGKVPLSVEDPSAQSLLWAYAQRRRAVDAEFSADLETALRAAGYAPRDVEHLDIVFKAPPGPGEECVFVEVENDQGRSVSIGEWVERPDGYHVLRLTPESINAVTA